MRRRTFSLLVIAVVAILITTLREGIHADAQGTPTPTSASAVALLRGPISVEQGLSEARNAGVKVIELRHSLQVMDQQIQGGYAPADTSSPSVVAQSYREEFSAMLNRAIEKADPQHYANNPRAMQAMQHSLDVLRQAQSANPAASVQSMRVEGTPDLNDRLTASNTR